MSTQEIVSILAGYLILATAFLHTGTRWAKIADATIVKDFGIALVATIILFAKIFVHGMITDFLLVSVAILFMVKAAYKIPWGVATRAWIVHFTALLFAYAIGFSYLLTIL